MWGEPAPTWRIWWRRRIKRAGYQGKLQIFRLLYGPYHDERAKNWHPNFKHPIPFAWLFKRPEKVAYKPIAEGEFPDWISVLDGTDYILVQAWFQSPTSIQRTKDRFTYGLFGWTAYFFLMWIGLANLEGNEPHSLERWTRILAVFIFVCWPAVMLFFYLFRDDKQGIQFSFQKSYFWALGHHFTLNDDTIFRIMPHRQGPEAERTAAREGRRPDEKGRIYQSAYEVIAEIGHGGHQRIQLAEIAYDEHGEKAYALQSAIYYAIDEARQRKLGPAPGRIATYPRPFAWL